MKKRLTKEEKLSTIEIIGKHLEKYHFQGQ